MLKTQTPGTLFPNNIVEVLKEQSTPEKLIPETVLKEQSKTSKSSHHIGIQPSKYKDAVIKDENDIIKNIGNGTLADQGNNIINKLDSRSEQKGPEEKFNNEEVHQSDLISEKDEPKVGQFVSYQDLQKTNNQHLVSDNNNEERPIEVANAENNSGNNSHNSTVTDPPQCKSYPQCGPTAATAAANPDHNPGQVTYQSTSTSDYPEIGPTATDSSSTHTSEPTTLSIVSEDVCSKPVIDDPKPPEDTDATEPQQPHDRGKCPEQATDAHLTSAELAIISYSHVTWPGGTNATPKFFEICGGNHQLEPETDLVFMGESSLKHFTYEYPI